MRLRGSYSYLYIDLKKAAGSSTLSSPRSTEGSSPHHQVAIQSSLDLPGKIEFDQTYRYVSALPAQLVGSYGTADLRLGWHFHPNFEFSVKGQNLLQPHHAEFGGDIGGLVLIKRSVGAEITWRR